MEATLLKLFLFSLFVFCHFPTLVIADLTKHHDKRQPETVLSERLDYFGLATGREAAPLGEGLRRVGCYDAWDKNQLLYTTSLFLEFNDPEECRKKCQEKEPYAFILLKGNYCSCLAWDDFKNTHVSDELCHVECPGNSDAICGGHHEFSVYCDSNGGDCENFVIPPIQDLYEQHNALELRKNGSTLVGHLEPIYPCVKCAGELASCILSSITPSYDYIPENTPSICAEYCARPVSYYTYPEEKTREPSKFAFTGWDTRQMTDTTNTMGIPICKCSDSIFDKFLEIEEENCTRVCPDADDLCGSEDKGTFTVYCADPKGCLLETPPPTSTSVAPTTDHPPATTESTTEPEPSQTSKSTPSPTEGIVTDKPKPTLWPTDGETWPVTTIPTTTTPKDPVDPICAPMCSGMDSLGQLWTGCPQRETQKPCPNADDSSLRTAKWFCTPVGIFEGNHPDMSDCRTEWVDQFQQKLGDGDEPIPPERANTLLNLIETEMRQTSYFGHEISQILGYVGTIFKRLPHELISSTEFDELAQKSLDIGNEALANQRPWLEITQGNRSRTLTNLFNVVEETLYDMSSIDAQNGSESMEKTFLKAKFTTGAGHGSKAGISDSTLSYPFARYSEPNRIVLPRGWSNAIEGDHAYYQGFSTSREAVKNILPQSGGFEANHATSASFTALNTGLIGFVLTGSSSSEQNAQSGRSVEFPDAGVTITLRHEVEAWGDGPKTMRRKLHDGEKVTVALGSAKCVYWDVQKLDWSSAGCKLVKSDRFSTVCECSHLTNFAVLFDTHSYTSKQLALEIITIVLCSLSVVCLLSTIVIFKVLRSTHNSRTTITSNLAGCLLVGNSLVLLVMDRHYFDMSHGICAATGILIHYAFLSAFMWMGIEGYYLYKLMIHVFDSGSDHLRMYRILGYGVPVLIVGLTGVIGFLKGEDAYGGDMFCWLQGHYIWSFLVPVALVVVTNLVILFITLKTAYQVKTSTAQVQDRVKSYRTWARGCLSLSVLLGLTWTIGFLITLDHYSGSLVFAYIFTILNGSQGIWLFTFHCLLNEKVSAAAARRNINLPTWLSGSVSKSGGAHQPPSPSYLGSRSKTNIKTVFADVRGKDAKNVGALEIPEEPRESSFQTRRRSYTLREKDVRSGQIAEDSGGTVSSVDSYRTSSTDAANCANASSSQSSSVGSQKNLIVDRRKAKI